MSKTVSLSPSPQSLVNSLRDLGYSVETAIADVLDNSISAYAMNIEIAFSWNQAIPWIAVIDDGVGMNEDTLINAMRFGSTNPLEQRHADDLGRFGLGLKTASLSQCRRLTVLSKYEHEVSCCRWDINYLNTTNDHAWNLLLLSQDDIAKSLVLSQLVMSFLKARSSGTIVLWEDLDRANESKREKAFNAELFAVKQHLELVFHRFLSPDAGQKKLSISMNGSLLEAFNPFFTKSLATQELEEQKILFEERVITVQPFILPHHSKVTPQEYEFNGGKDGYLHNQGFYVYRNRRLIIYGTWFKLLKKEELNKLVRVRIDIPNTLDHAWKIDIKKSHASPPEWLRNELKNVIDRVADRGQKVYRQRGTRLRSNVQQPVWNRRITSGVITYEINREHALLKQLLDTASRDTSRFLYNYLSIIEASFPTNLFFHDMASKPEDVQSPKIEEAQLFMLLEIAVSALREMSQANVDIRQKILEMEPFSTNRQVIGHLLDKMELNK